MTGAAPRPEQHATTRHSPTLWPFQNTAPTAVGCVDCAVFAARRHDVLAALSLYALCQTTGVSRRILRLILLLTARYNWQSDRLAIGRDEIARLWTVDPRTVRREMAHLRGMGWIEIRRSAARGRVTLYGLGHARLLADLAAHWSRLGPDFAARLGSLLPAVPKGGDALANMARDVAGATTADGLARDGLARDGSEKNAGAVLPFLPPNDTLPAQHLGQAPALIPPCRLAAAQAAWMRIRTYLAAEDPDIAAAWFDRLSIDPIAGSDAPKSIYDPDPPDPTVAPQLTLRAPSAFVARYIETRLFDRLNAACRCVAPEYGSIALQAPPRRIG